MSTTVYLLTISIPFATALAVFAMKYATALAQAKARAAGEDAYRRLAEGFAARQGESARALEGLGGAVTDIRQRLASIESVLTRIE